MQQQPPMTFYGGGAAPNSVMMQPVAPYRPQQPHTRPAILPHRKRHMVFGAVQMAVGAFCFLLDLIAVFLKTDYQRYGAGIYSGVFFFIPGLLGYMAGRHNNKCCVIGCMVMNIIGTCLAVTGLSMAAVEYTDMDIRPTLNSDMNRFWNNTTYGSRYIKTYVYSHGDFLRGKSICVLLACTFEFIFTIVHCSFTCASCCPCCLPRSYAAERGQVAATAVQGVQFPQQTYFSMQQPQTQPYLQQMAPQPAPVGYAPYPGQPAMQIHPENDAAMPPPFSPAVGHESAYPAQPRPPYNPEFGHGLAYPA